MILLMMLVLLGQTLMFDPSEVDSMPTIVIDPDTRPVNDDIVLTFVEEDSPRFGMFSYACDVRDGITHYETCDDYTAVYFIENFGNEPNTVITYTSPYREPLKPVNRDDVPLWFKGLITTLPVFFLAIGYWLGRRRDR